MSSSRTTPTGMFSLDLEDEQRWGPQEPIAAHVHGLSVRTGFNGRGLGGFMLDCCASRVRDINRRYHTSFSLVVK
jgi:hypothetical protein